MMTFAHLTASFQLGGPERQMLGLADALPPEFRSVFFSFAENGRCSRFLGEASRRGYDAGALACDTPHLPAMVSEVCQRLAHAGVDVLCCHGYKANFVGLLAAQRIGIPIVMVFRGWTGEDVKVKSYEALDVFCFRQATRVVCVSRSQAQALCRCGIRPERIVVIRNAIDGQRFRPIADGSGNWLRSLLPAKSFFVGTAGRLVKEKGLLDLLEVANISTRLEPGIGFVLLGDGPLRQTLAARIHEYRLQGHVALAGFRRDLDNLLPHFDLLVHPSYREGMPNVVLEACAAGVPVIATDVGGTREIIQHGWNGCLIAPGDRYEMLNHILELAQSPSKRQLFSRRAMAFVAHRFAFAQQSRQYTKLFQALTTSELEVTAP